MRIPAFLLFLLTCVCLSAQQVPDLNYEPPIHNPVYPTGTGPVILVDEGHHNFHKTDGRYAPFANVLRKDGYQVMPYLGKFEPESLRRGKILVIANPLHASNVDNWALPTPSAFTEEEINTLDLWVQQGGSLFLIADHMPWPGAAGELAKVFGFEFFNGFNVCVINPAFFWKVNGTIADNVISTGRDSTEWIHQIPLTEGQAFTIPPDAEPILIFDDTNLILMPDTAWVFPDHTPFKNIDGFSQGAFKRHGKGRIVVFGEASMFSAQTGDPGRRKMGMNSLDGKENYKLLLNVIHWLDGLLD